MGVDSAFDAAAQDNWRTSHDMFARRSRALLYIATTGCQSLPGSGLRSKP